MDSFCFPFLLVVALWRLGALLLGSPADLFVVVVVAVVVVSINCRAILSFHPCADCDLLRDARPLCAVGLVCWSWRNSANKFGTHMSHATEENQSLSQHSYGFPTLCSVQLGVIH